MYTENNPKFAVFSMFAWIRAEILQIRRKSEKYTGIIFYLKGVWHEIFDFRFFSWISVPQAPKYSVGAILNFSKIRGDIRELLFITGVNDTGDKQ